MEITCKIGHLSDEGCRIILFSQIYVWIFSITPKYGVLSKQLFLRLQELSLRCKIHIRNNFLRC